MGDAVDELVYQARRKFCTGGGHKEEGILGMAVGLSEQSKQFLRAIFTTNAAHWS